MRRRMRRGEWLALALERMYIRRNIHYLSAHKCPSSRYYPFCLVLSKLSVLLMKFEISNSYVWWVALHVTAAHSSVWPPKCNGIERSRDMCIAFISFSTCCVADSLTRATQRNVRNIRTLIRTLYYFSTQPNSLLCCHYFLPITSRPIASTLYHLRSNLGIPYALVISLFSFSILDITSVTHFTVWEMARSTSKRIQTTLRHRSVCVKSEKKKLWEEGKKREMKREKEREKKKGNEMGGKGRREGVWEKDTNHNVKYTHNGRN